MTIDRARLEELRMRVATWKHQPSPHGADDPVNGTDWQSVEMLDAERDALFAYIDELERRLGIGRPRDAMAESIAAQIEAGGVEPFKD